MCHATPSHQHACSRCCLGHLWGVYQACYLFMVQRNLCSPACVDLGAGACRHALCVQLYLKMDRVDKAEQALKV